MEKVKLHTFKMREYEEFYERKYSERTRAIAENIETDLEEVTADDLKDPKKRERFIADVLNNVDMLTERCYEEGHLDGYRLCEWLHMRTK